MPFFKKAYKLQITIYVNRSVFKKKTHFGVKWSLEKTVIKMEGKKGKKWLEIQSPLVTVYLKI